MSSAFQFDVFDFSAFESNPKFLLDAEIRLDKAFRIDAVFSGALHLDAWLIRHIVAGAATDAVLFHPSVPGSFTVSAVIGAFARVSQSPVEVLVSPWSEYARVSQSVIEVLIVRSKGRILINAVIKTTTMAGFTVSAAIGTGAGFTLDATFVPLRFFVDAIKLKTRTGSFPVAAIIRVPTSKTFPANAVLFAHESGSFAVGAIATLTVAHPILVNAVLLETFSVGLHVDADLKRTGLGSLHLDAWLIRHQTGSFTANALLQKTATSTFAVRAVILATVPKTLTVNADVHGYSTGSFTIDAKVGGYSAVFTISAVILATVGPGLQPLTFPGISRTRGGLTANALSPAFPINAGEQAVVVVVIPPSDGGDLSIAGAVTGYPVPLSAGEHDIVAAPGIYYVVSSKGNVYRPTLSGAGFYKDWGTGLQFTIGAFVQPTFTIDARFVWTFGSTFTLGATVRAHRAGSFTVAAFIQPLFHVDARIAPRHFTLDAWIRCQFTIDAWLDRHVTGSFGVNAFIRGYFRVSAAVTRSQSHSFAVAASIVHPISGSFTVDAWILEYFKVNASKVITYYRHDDRGLKVDAWKISGLGSSFTLNARILPHFTVNAVIFGSRSGSFSVGAYVSNAMYGSFHMAAFVQPVFKVDALFLDKMFGSTMLDAALVNLRQSSFAINASITGFLVNAVIYAPNQQARFTIFAIKGKRHGTGSFTVDAEKYDASAYWDQYWEQWFHPHFTLDATKAIHPTGSFHVGAAIILPGEPIISIFLDAAIVGVGTGAFLLEAFIWAQHTVVYEGEGETVSILETTSVRLTFPGINGVGPNQLYGPFYPPDYLPVTLTVWEPPSAIGSRIGIQSANEDLWVDVIAQTQSPGIISVVYGPTITITFWPSYATEPHYVYVWNPAGYDASMTGEALLSYSQQIDVVLSHPAPTIDAWIVGTIGEPFTLDAEIVGLTKQGAFTLGADLSAQGERRGSWTLGASILGSSTALFRIGAVLAYAGYTHASLTLDAFIQPSLTVDAFIHRVSSGSFTLDYQWVRPTLTGRVTIDAQIAAVGDHRTTLNAVIGTSHTLRFYLAASIASPPSVYTVDAVIAPWFGVDAWISPMGGGLGGFSVGAYVRGSSYIIFPGDGGAPTDPLGNPPALTRKFAIKIEAGFPQSPSQADAALAASTLSQIATLQAQIATLQAQLDALLCIPVAERISSENAAIKDLNEQIAALEHQLLVARHQDPGEFWMDAVSKMQVYLDTYRALTNPTNAQTVAYETDLKTYNYDLLRLRMAREIQRTWVDITGDCIWSQTDFTQMARTGPGTFTITMKGPHPEFVGGEEIHFEIDDLRVFGGWVSSVEKGYFFDAAIAPKTVLHGTDYNILFDRLVVRNWPWEFANHHKTGGNAGPYRNWPAFKKGTMDDAMIEYVFGNYLLPDLPMGFDYETGVFPIATPAPESSWVMTDPGSPARVFMQSVSQITSGVWCIDPYMVLQYHDRETVTAPYPLTDGLGGISSRALSITTDISQMIDDDLVWGTLGKTIEGEIMVTHEIGDGHWRERYWLAAIASVQQYIQNLLADASRTMAQNKELTVYRARLVAYKKNLAAARATPEASSYALYGFWQYGEFRQDIFHQKWLDIRARAILLRYDDPIMMATATVWDPGYQAGQVVNVKSSVYGIDINLVIRQLHISFTVAKEPVGGRYYALPQYDLTMGLDPESPWNIYDFLPYPGMSTPGLGMDVTGG